MHDDIKWFLGLIVIFGVIWWIGRNAIQNSPEPAGAGITPSVGEKAPPSSSIPEKIKAAEKKVGELQEELRKTQEAASVSPLRGKIFIESLSSNSDNPNNEYLTIRAAGENNAPVAISGLTIKSLGTGNEARIPGGWKLPYPGMSKEGNTVMLEPGGAAYIVSGRSPINISFESNLCTGYFTSGSSFTPPLSFSCPSPITEPLPQPPNRLSETCLDFLASVPSCATPTIPLYLSNDGSCQAHIVKNINYNACVTIHKSEPGFYRGAWYLYLNRTSRFWGGRREAAELRDQNGKLIDSRSY